MAQGLKDFCSFVIPYLLLLPLFYFHIEKRDLFAKVILAEFLYIITSTFMSTSLLEDSN